MLKFRLAVPAAVLVCVLALASCGGSSSNAEPSPSTSPPLDKMRAIGLRYHATQAWWATVSTSEALKLFGGPWGDMGATPDPEATVSVLIMKGRFQGGMKGAPYRWAAVGLGFNGTASVKSTEQFDTSNVNLTPLQLTTTVPAQSQQ